MEKEPSKAEEPILKYESLDPNGIYTYWDYIRWQFEERVELIKGKIFKMSPAHSPAHQEISFNLSRLVGNLLWTKACKVYHAPFDVRLPIPSAKKDSTVVQPDLCVICDLDKMIDKRACNGAPDLVMEIVSRSNSKHDIKTKFELYQESGVKEYWIVFPNDRLVNIYTLGNGKYIGLRPFTEGMTAESVLFPDLKIDVSDIFHKVD